MRSRISGSAAAGGGCSTRASGTLPLRRAIPSLAPRRISGAPGRPPASAPILIARLMRWMPAASSMTMAAVASDRLRSAATRASASGTVLTTVAGPFRAGSTRMTTGCASARAAPAAGMTSPPAARARTAARKRSAPMAGERLRREGGLGAGRVINHGIDRPGRLEVVARQVGRDAAAGLERAAQARENGAIARVVGDRQRLLGHRGAAAEGPGEGGAGPPEAALDDRLRGGDLLAQLVAGEPRQLAMGQGMGADLDAVGSEADERVPVRERQRPRVAGVAAEAVERLGAAADEARADHEAVGNPEPFEDRVGDGGDVLEAGVDREMEQALGAGRRAFEPGQELGRGDEVAFALQRPEEAVGALALVVEQVVEGEAADAAGAAPVGKRAQPVDDLAQHRALGALGERRRRRHLLAGAGEGGLRCAHRSSRAGLVMA